MACYRENCTEETSIYYRCFHAGNLQEWTVSINCENGVVLVNEKHGLLEQIAQCATKAEEQRMEYSSSLLGDSFTFINEENLKSLLEEELNKLFPDELNVLFLLGDLFYDY